ncbi:MAG: hypothetical protein ACI8XU_002557 [Kiritimatiellia bacterium]|jgi:hypothetical protein
MLTMSSPDTQIYCPRRLTGRLITLSMGFLALSLNGCSNEAMYQAIRQNGLRACEEMPTAQQASRKAQYQKDYATYKRERDSLKDS